MKAIVVKRPALFVNTIPMLVIFTGNVEVVIADPETKKNSVITDFTSFLLKFLYLSL